MAWATLAAQVAIVVTGAGVRLTGSGLGCTDWPGCQQDQLVPAWGFHPWVEFGNRLVSFAVVAAAGVAVLGARRRRPYRAALVRLSWGQVGGVIAQALVGAVLVRLELDPRLTLAHFVLSLVLIADATALVHLSGADVARAPSEPAAPPVGTGLRAVVWLLSAAVVVLVGTGTVVTGSGPHGGDERAERFDYTLRSVARIHAGALWLFASVLVVMAVMVWRQGPRASRLRPPLNALLALTGAQAALGYLQYALGVPAGLVALHVLGSTLVWACTVALLLAAVIPTSEPSAVVAEDHPVTRSGPVLSAR